MDIKPFLLTLLTISLLSFSTDNNMIEFSYPKNSKAKITITTDKLKKFKEEWRGEDYYYLSEKGKNDIICSVLFYKLSKVEQETFVDLPGKAFNTPEVNPGYPLFYFSANSNLKKFESNSQQWGELTNDFMFSQTDIKEMSGMEVNQKNMYAYTMFGKDLFLKVHLSKIFCTPEDSISMRQILDGIQIIK